MAERNIKKSSSSSRRIIYSLAALPLLIIFAVITYKLSFQIYKQRQIDKEIEGLQKEIDELSQENHDLDELVNYLQTDLFKEKEAKDKLNLIKEGEELVLIRENDSGRKEVQKKDDKNAEVVVSRPNYYWWWYYFFKI